jgi:hypothetical protein
MPGFEYFLSCGIPGKLEGERYKKSPELVKAFVQQAPAFKAPAPYIVFKRWDALDEADEPDVVVFFAQADVLSGLFTLANFHEAEPDGVFCPFAAGCGSIVQYPYLEGRSARPRAVLGMFDVSARPCVPHDTLSFAVPMSKFERMVTNMTESFLITKSWDQVKQRMEQSRPRSASGAGLDGAVRVQWLRRYRVVRPTKSQVASGSAACPSHCLGSGGSLRIGRTPWKWAARRTRERSA